MATRGKPYIAVVGGGSCTAEQASLAEKVGEEIALAGAVLVCGGLGGVMEAACHGAKKRGGSTIGIVPGHDYHSANAFVDHVICTGVGEARNLMVVLTSDGVIALPGEFGTLSEIAFAMIYGRPVISLFSWNVSERIFTAETAEEAVSLVLEKISR